MHGQPRHCAQVCRSTLPNVIVVASEVLVRELKHKRQTDSVSSIILKKQSGQWHFLFKWLSSLFFGAHIFSLLTAIPSLHFQLSLSMGFLRLRPIQNQCCSCSSDSLWTKASSSSSSSSWSQSSSSPISWSEVPTYPKASWRTCKTKSSSSEPLMLSRSAPCLRQYRWACSQLSFCSSCG